MTRPDRRPRKQPSICSAAHTPRSPPRTLRFPPTPGALPRPPSEFTPTHPGHSRPSTPAFSPVHPRVLARPPPRSRCRLGDAPPRRSGLGSGEDARSSNARVPTSGDTPFAGTPTQRSGTPVCEHSGRGTHSRSWSAPDTRTWKTAPHRPGERRSRSFEFRRDDPCPRTRTGRRTLPRPHPLPGPHRARRSRPGPCRGPRRFRSPHPRGDRHRHPAGERLHHLAEATDPRRPAGDRHLPATPLHLPAGDRHLPATPPRHPPGDRHLPAGGLLPRPRGGRHLPAGARHHPRGGRRPRAGPRAGGTASSRCARSGSGRSSTGPSARSARTPG